MRQQVDGEINTRGVPQVQGQGWRPRGATQGAVAARAQEGLEELYHIEVQEGQQ